MGMTLKQWKSWWKKRNDAEHINWTARFHKILRKLNVTFSVEIIPEFRFVLIYMFETVRQDIKGCKLFSILPCLGIPELVHQNRQKGRRHLRDNHPRERQPNTVLCVADTFMRAQPAASRRANTQIMRTNPMSALRPTQNWSRTKEYRLPLFPLRDRAIIPI